MADDPALATSPSSTPEPAPEEARPASGLPFGLTVDELVWLAAVGIGFAAAFGPELIWMFGRWMASEYYGHGLFIPLISAYLMYRRRDAVAALVARPDRLGAVLIVVGLLLHVLAVLVDVNFASNFAAIIVLWGFVAWSWGRPAALALLFPIAYLSFMVPVDRLLIDAFASPLQLTAAKMASGFSGAIGIPVTRDGVNLSVPQYTFEVAVPCSGLKSLTTMTALAALFAYLVKGRLWRRLVLVGSALPVALLANASRVTLILLVARSMGANMAEGFFHGFSGVVVFVIGLLGLYGVGRLLGCHTLRDGI